MWHVLWRGVVFVGVWWGSLREVDLFEELGVDGWTILKWMLKK